MKRISALLLVCCLFLGTFSGCKQKEAAPTLPASPTIPLLNAFSATDIDGNVVDQQIFSGHKLTMVNIWATFCSPCIREMPDLAQLNTAYGEDFQVVGIVIDITDQYLQVLPEKKADAVQIIAETGADYLHLMPSESLYRAILGNVSSVPVTVFVDESGNQVGSAYIGSRSKTEWATIIEPLLK